MKHTRTLQLEEDVLCVRFSPDHRLLAASLLDCTVKVFYTDTLKVPMKHVCCVVASLSVRQRGHVITEHFSLSLLQFFLSLYGHKLPVLCLDISHVSIRKLLSSPNFILKRT